MKILSVASEFSVADRQTHIQSVRQTDRQTDRHTDRDRQAGSRDKANRYIAANFCLEESKNDEKFTCN
jgi:hypothetical protein